MKTQKILNSLTNAEAEMLLYDWPFWARDHQLPPGGSWTHWLLLAGRGFGKTRTGAEWVRYRIENKLSRRVALVAPTAADVRDTMVEGESGILAVSPPWVRPVFEPAKRRLTWPCGAVATLFSADEPDRLRGPQHDGAWVDELAAWRYQEVAWDMLLFGLRLGQNPQCCITTTPRPTPLIQALVQDKNVHLTHGTTFDNLDNLAPTFKEDVIAKYKGTRLGRQELMAEILSDTPGALWSKDMIEKIDPDHLPPLERIVMAVDPPVSTGQSADECGVIVAALGQDGCGYVLADLSSQGLSPLSWAKQIAVAYYRYEASELIIEVNQGGDLVETLVKQVDRGLNVRPVRASKSKLARAEPVALLYEKGQVFHCDEFSELNQQLCHYTPNGNSGHSPDRLDALVWALTALMVHSGRHKPRLKSL